MTKTAFPVVSLVFAGICLASGPAVAQGSDTSNPGAESPSTTTKSMGQSIASSDRNFLMEAAQNGMAEIEASKIAQSKATSPEVKQFASQMVDDHMKTDEELKSLASSKGVTLPDKPSPVQRMRLSALESTSSEKFDKRFTEQFGVKAHQDTVKLFKKEAAQGRDPELKSFADRTLPALEHHLTMAQSLEEHVQSSGAKPSDTSGSKSY